ncbi:hypothetical protein PUG81_27680 [Erwiniaceae bacterium L1_54_6]|nr:hypothetical protein [Erwiniaceae bacterium L1_54_6]
MNSMRYNPSQALRLLLDPLISESSAKMMTDFGGFLHSEPGKTEAPYPGRFTDTSHPVNSFPRRACPATGFFAHPYRQPPQYSIRIKIRSPPGEF